MNDITETPKYPAIVYSPTEAVIADLKERSLPLATMDGPEGYEQRRLVIAQTRTMRGQVEKTRVGLKESALKYGRLVDSEAKRITGLIEEIEKPLKDINMGIDLEKMRAAEAKVTAERRAAEAKVKAEQEAEEARLKAIRDAEAEANRIERERLKALQAEQDRIQAKYEADRKAEQKRIDDENLAERRRIAEENRAQIAAQKAAEEKLRAERQAEAERFRAEQAQLAEERRAIAEERRKVEAVQRERERIAAAEKAKAEREEYERLTRERLAKEAAEKAERDRLQAEADAKRRAEEEAAEQRAIEASRPEVERINRFADAIESLRPVADLTMPHAQQFMDRIRALLLDMARECREYTGPKARNRNPKQEVPTA